MDPFSPINGITLDRYADLAADVSELSDPREQADTVARKGVNGTDWEAAKTGWTARMQDPSLNGAVGARFMPLYQASLARKNATANAVSGAMPGAMPPPGYGQQPAGYPPPAQAGYAGYPPQPPPPPQMGYGGYPPQPPRPGYPPQPYNQGAAQFGNDVGNAFNAFGSALDSLVSGAIGAIAVGSQVLVLWSDGQRYPATVRAMQNGQAFVAFPDGRQVWVPQHVVTLRSVGF